MGRLWEKEKKGLPGNPLAEEMKRTTPQRLRRGKKKGQRRKRGERSARVSGKNCKRKGRVDM